MIRKITGARELAFFIGRHMSENGVLAVRCLGIFTQRMNAVGIQRPAIAESLLQFEIEVDDVGAHRATFPPELCAKILPLLESSAEFQQLRVAHLEVQVLRR